MTVDNWQLTNEQYPATSMCEYSFNPYYQGNPMWQNTECCAFTNDDIWDFHRSLQGYKPTPLVTLPSLAQKLGLGQIFVKDESNRFDVKAFKPLGASYAIYHFIKKQWEAKFKSEFTHDDFADVEKMKQLGSFTFCAASDGNHGRAVAWTARKLKQKAVIYMPGNTVRSRIENIESEGARVVVIEGTYDDCVERIKEDAKENGWHVISDTAYEGNMEIPNYIMAGYTTIFREVNPVCNRIIDIVFLQTGVGGLTAAGTWYFVNRYKENRPKLISVEPTESDCFLESIRFGKGEPKQARGNQESIMAGLNCGIPSPVAWPVIKDGVDLFMSVSDDYAIEAMRQYYYPEKDDPRIISGESGASGLAGLLALMTNDKFSAAREKLGISSNSKILIINTEGDTDPVNFEKIVMKFKP
ncbi:MAG: diaminopropionate ammonia-lyase [Bacteroidota bacterium]